ncbi:hypothetical protein BHM03_00054131 [Ensete ventricosum]|nr:hypothetical protein BHM03_00054131 [Ensete ventricosum]
MVGRLGNWVVDSRWSLLLILEGVCCDVLEGVVHPWLEDLAWLTFVSKTSLFASAFFRSPTYAPIFNAFTKVMIGGGVRCYVDSTPLMVKLAK